MAYDYVVSTGPDAPEYGLLAAIRDDRGRALLFSYDKPGPGVASRVTRITGPGGLVAYFGYDAQGRLASLQRGSSNPVRYLYEDARHHWALTGVLAEDGSRLSTFTYDASGRAISTERAGGSDRYATSWSSPPMWRVEESYDAAHDVYWRVHSMQLPEGTQVSTPSGASLAYTFTQAAGVARLASRTLPPGAGSPAATLREGHDAQGFIASRDEPSGVRTCWARDSLGREERRIEGLPTSADCTALTANTTPLPAGATQTTTTWHPDWQLPVWQAAPGRIILHVYNGQPDPLQNNAVARCSNWSSDAPELAPPAVLCKRMEIATTDGSGALGLAAPPSAQGTSKLTQWTYNRLGQVLSYTDEGGATTNMSYFAEASSTQAVGDLAIVRNALGHVTRYTRYDALGNWLESSDANGVVTTKQLDAQQRLVASTTADLTRQFAYHSNGLLAQATEPDGSWTAFAYDTAQRLVSITNSLGHRIDYTLDAAGNRIAESASDATGSLRRQVTRLFNALNRLQQQAGLEVAP